MEQHENTPQQPAAPETSGTDIHSILGELIQKENGNAKNTGQPAEKSQSGKTPLANLKAMLSTVDAVAQEDKGVSEKKAPQPPETAEIPEQKPPASGQPAESEAVRRLDTLIKEYQSQKKR